MTMKCRATGSDWRTGKLMMPEYQMPHGHRGACDNESRLLTDDQLRAECERRWPPGERDPRWTQLEAERDEWRRRAEAAESELADPKRVIHVKTDEGELVPLGYVHDCGRLTLVVIKRDGERLPMFDLFASGRERESAGIASLPERDTSLDIDPLDLLCDDA